MLPGNSKKVKLTGTGDGDNGNQVAVDVGESSSDALDGTSGGNLLAVVDKDDKMETESEATTDLELSLNAENSASAEMTNALVTAMKEMEAEEQSGPAIGIDLGTTHSCVAVYSSGSVKVIDYNGISVIPSYVSFTSEEWHVGSYAKDLAVSNLKNTIFDAKRMIGRKFDDKELQADTMGWPFEVINVSDKPMIELNMNDEKKVVAPEFVSSIVLSKMKEIAEIKLGQQVTKAVITVPAHFNNAQRQATKDAGTIAGLKKVHILNEPTAAAIAYGVTTNAIEEQKCLVFDLGGGTFDVTILNFNGEVFEVVCTVGNAHLGGQDFTGKIVDMCVKEFKDTFKKDLQGDKKAMHRLWVNCEKAKIILTERKEYKMELDYLMGETYVTTIKRDDFETINRKWFEQTIVIVDEAIAKANVRDDKDIDDVVLVGGSSRIPKIKELLRKRFPNKELKQCMSFDTAVAEGAAMRAHSLKHEEEKGIYLMDVIPKSLGVSVREEGLMKVLIEANTPYPTHINNDQFTTSSAHQTTVRIKVYEGENELVKENNLLGEFLLVGLKQTVSGGKPQIHVKFDIDRNGLLTVTAWEVNTTTKKKNEKKIDIILQNSSLQKEEIAKMRVDAEQWRNKSTFEEAAIALRNELESYCSEVKNLMDGMTPTNISEVGRSLLQHQSTLVLDWINKNPCDLKEHYEKLLGIMKTNFDQIVKEYSGRALN